MNAKPDSKGKPPARRGGRGIKSLLLFLAVIMGGGYAVYKFMPATKAMDAFADGVTGSQALREGERLKAEVKNLVNQKKQDFQNMLGR